MHHHQVIRADPDLPATLADDLGEGVTARLRKRARATPSTAKAPERQTFPPPASVPAWARASGRAGEGDPFFFAGVGLALLDSFLRRDPPSAGALRSRLALKSTAASAKILRLNADEGALRDLRFAIGEDASPGARLLRLWRDLAGRPPALNPDRIRDAAAALDLPLADAKPLAQTLSEQSRAGDPVSAAAKAAAATFSVFPDAPAAEAEILALWVFDMVIAIRLRWPRPVALLATKILEPSLRSGGGARPNPGDPAWPNAAAGAIALAAGSALDLAADLARRSETLLAVAPKLRSKPAAKIVALLLSQDCLAPAEAARQAPMTDRAARRLFDRLVALGAAREFSGRPTFRLYGL
jgi:Protein of unknown function (DUF1403)